MSVKKMQEGFLFFSDSDIIEHGQNIERMRKIRDENFQEE
jgi:hypothetical protein